MATNAKESVIRRIAFFIMWICGFRVKIGGLEGNVKRHHNWAIGIEILLTVHFYEFIIVLVQRLLGTFKRAPIVSIRSLSNFMMRNI